MFRLFFISLFLCTGQILFAQEKGLQGYIEISVADAVDKPYSTVIFSLNGKRDALPGIIISNFGKTDTLPQGFVFINSNRADTIHSMFVRIIDVNEDKFHRLDSLIQEDTVADYNNVLRYPISVSISINGSERHMQFWSKTFIQSLFRKIEDEIDGEDKEGVNNDFTSLMRRLS